MATDIHGSSAPIIPLMQTKQAGHEEPSAPAESPASDGSWRAIVEALPDAALTLDADGVISHQNRLISSLFPEMRVGSTMGQLLRNPDLKDAVEHAAQTSRPIVTRMTERVPVARTIEATVTKLNLSGVPADLLVTFRDLTEREKIEQMRADFVANASHELRTPLAALKGYIETLQGPARDDLDARERFLKIMWSQSVRMSRLVDDLLSLSRVEMRAHLAPSGKADLNEIAGYVVQSLEALAASQNASITLEKLDGPASIKADREEIIQALQNLVHNALKYGREDGNVRISVRRETSPAGADHLTVSVADEGAGIPSHHIPRLVERFYRVNAASSRAKGGTGLGLAIVKHIMLRHRGDLSITSKMGEGSVFKLVFDEISTA